MKRNLMVGVVLVTLGFVSVASAEPREAAAQGKPPAQAKTQIKAKATLNGNAATAQKPSSNKKAAAKRVAPGKVVQAGATNSTGATGSSTATETKPPTTTVAPRAAASAMPSAPELTDPPTPVVSVLIGGASLSGGSLPNASRVVSGTRKPLLACWDSPTLPTGNSGVAMRVTLSIGPDGAVANVKTSVTGEATTSTVQCVESTFAKAKFTSPEKKPATLITTVSYIATQ